MIKNLCIIQARMGSTRLPNKVLMEASGVPLLQYEVDRVKRSNKIDKIVIATGDNNANDPIQNLADKIGVDCFRGSENDVLDRYYKCSLNYPNYDNIIRITGDCPLIDPQVIDQVIQFFEDNGYDYACNVDVETFPDGLDVEVFTKEALVESAEQAKLTSEREHVTQYIRKNEQFTKGNLAAPADYSQYRLTVDNAEDFEVVSFLIKNCPAGAGYLDYIQILEKNPEIKLKNSKIQRNEGLAKSLQEDKIVN
ncbi:MAG: glycosyltransferase family protein [Candidatus Komeilibacteria bacterium]|nr:glycosyltransferase family protein [Candidatus Komeilibacteria bacterium]